MEEQIEKTGCINYDSERNQYLCMRLTIAPYGTLLEIAVFPADFLLSNHKGKVALNTNSEFFAPSGILHHLCGLDILNQTSSNICKSWPFTAGREIQPLIKYLVQLSHSLQLKKGNSYKSFFSQRGPYHFWIMV
jgi:hypothetical protein